MTNLETNLNTHSKRVLVCGAGGFIGGHLAKRLKTDGCWVRGVDIKENPYQNFCDEMIIGDLRDPLLVERVLESIDEIYQLAADMGGSFYVFTGLNDADIMHNSCLINLNILHAAVKVGIKRIFYSSSACMYSMYNQMDPDNPNCKEDSAYPANPDSDYGWEKLFSERLYLAFARNKGLTVRIARFHNIFGPMGAWNNTKEKAPAALCRKVIMAQKNGQNEIEVWGDGLQTRSFLYVDECIEGVIRLMESDCDVPINIGSEEMVSINEFVEMISIIAGNSKVSVKHIPGPTGVRGRNSDNTLIFEKLNWKPNQPLSIGLTTTFNWIKEQIDNGIPDSKY